MTRAAVTVSLAVALTSCAGGQRAAPLPPLEDGGEVYLYAAPFPREADAISFTIDALAADPASAAPVALEVRTRAVAGAAMRDQALLASGRIPAGSYGGFLIKVSGAKLATESGSSDLIGPAEPVRIPLPFTLARRQSLVVSLTFRPGESLEQGFRFSPSFGAVIPGLIPPQVVGYCSSTYQANLAAFERGKYLVSGVVPTGRAPRGLALDPNNRRAYVALAGDDAIDVVDMAASSDRRRARLLGGDRPREVALTPDRSVLLSLNEGSRTVAFLDPGSLVELGRVPVGEAPSSLLVDRPGRRAYVFNRKSNSISVIDVANRAVAATVATDAEPLQGAINRDGSRLYVIFAGSNNMSVLGLPGLSLVSRVFVGLGATAVLVDPRTDLVYVAKGPEHRIAVFDAFSAMPVDDFEVQGRVTWMTIDDAENALLALAPDRETVAVIDLTSRRTRATLQVGPQPYQVRVAGER